MLVSPMSNVKRPKETNKANEFSMSLAHGKLLESEKKKPFSVSHMFFFFFFFSMRKDQSVDDMALHFKSYSIRLVSNSPNEPNLISIFIGERISKMLKLLMDYNRDKESHPIEVALFISLYNSLNECTKTKIKEKHEKKNEKKDVYRRTTMNL